VRVNQAYSTLIPLILALSREGRGERIKVKGVNAFVLVQLRAGIPTEAAGANRPDPRSTAERFAFLV
jgi:hypothetical protein